MVPARKEKFFKKNEAGDINQIGSEDISLEFCYHKKHNSFCQSYLECIIIKSFYFHCGASRSAQ